MQALGHETFSLVAHDRGARVARRLALDYPTVINRLVVMDIIQALDFYENFDGQVVQDYFYFAFLTQDYPMPEVLISGDPEGFLPLILTGLSDRAVHCDTMALEVCLTANTRPAAITAIELIGAL